MASTETKSSTTKATSMWDLLTGPDIDAVRRWFQWHPSEIENCLEARAASLPDPLNAAELEELLSANTAWGADEASTKNIRHLADPHARVIIAGQQLGLLGGPLFSIYKALGAIGLAEKLGAQYPTLDFVPVFWVAGEDHDFAEVSEAAWVAKDGSLARLKVDHEGWAPGRMVGGLDCKPARQTILDMAEASTFDTDFKPQVMDLLARAYADGRSWQDAFCEILLELTRGLGLVIVSPLMSWVRHRGAAILAAEALHAGQTSAAVLRRAAELEKVGLTPSLHRHKGSINFFALDESGVRQPLRLEGESIVATLPQDKLADRKSTGEPEARRTIQLASSTEELAEQVMANPEAFAFNVVTRPMVQDSALPTVVQLVGPGEAAYFSQVEAAYEVLGRFAAMRFPRPRVVLVAPNVERALKKKNVSLEEVLNESVAAIVDKRLADVGENEDATELESLAARQLQELNSLARELGDNPGVAKAIEKLSKSMERGYEGIAGRLRDGRRKANGDLEQAVAKMQMALNPESSPQERVFNPVIPYAINHGLDWAQRLYPLIEVDGSGNIQPIYLSALGNSDPK